MLSYILAIAVGSGSVALYLSAFFLPEVHRKYDLIWSGVGMFYALVLWVCAARITGGVLLGQMASVALLAWFVWQTLSLRRSQTPAASQTRLPEGNSVGETWRATLDQLQSGFTQTPGYSDWDRIQTQVGNGAASVRGWVEAFFSTTLKTPPPNNELRSLEHELLNGNGNLNSNGESNGEPGETLREDSSKPHSK